jgi:hypothetical protein
LFRADGAYIKNERGKYLNVQGKTDTEGRHIQCNEAKSGQIHQQWDIVYVDEWKGEPTKGELNEEYGMYVERPFHVISMMKPNRYLELINNRNIVVKSRNAQNG